MNILNNMFNAVGEFVHSATGNRASMQQQQDFEERMSNTQYQRLVDDMTKAGLNPYSANSGGVSPNTPNSGVVASHGGLLTGIGSILNSAANMTRSMNDRNEFRHKNEIYNESKKLMNSAITIARIFK